MFNYGEAQKKGMTVDYGEKSGALELTMGWCTGVEHPGIFQKHCVEFGSPIEDVNLSFERSSAMPL